EREGGIDRGRHRRLAPPGTLPEVTVLNVLGPDPDGELLAAPAETGEGGKAPLIFLIPDPPVKPALARGDRVLARLRRLDEASYEARIIRRLDAVPPRIVGVIER